MDGTAVFGNAELQIGATIHGAVSLAGGGHVASIVPGDSIGFDPSLFPANYPLSPAPPLASENVQAAIDEVYDYASQVRTLDDAYDGGTPGPTGSGRTVIADSGSVQILDAIVPSDPIPVDNTDGKLEVVGGVKIGALNKPEIDLDPNRYGNSARIALGWTAWPDDAPFGGTGTVIANATDDGSFLNYNLRVATGPASGGGKVGNLFLRTG